MEHVDGLHLLASTDKLDRLGNHGADTEGSTTTSITIELGQYDTIEVEAVVELLRRVDGILTGHGIDHEESLVWTEVILEIADLVHHLLINGKTTGGIDDDHVVAIGLSLLDGMVGNHAHILVVWLAIYRNTHLLAYHLQLVDSGRTIHVTSHEQRFLTFLRLEHVGKFATECGLTRTLQTAHQDDGRVTFELEWSFLAAHQLSQLIVYQLDHQLSWFHGCEHVHAQRLLLHLVGEFLSHLIVDIGIKECTTHVLHGFSHVDLGNLTFTLQYFKRAL